ncbi:MAG: hypothetical protein ACOYD1_14025 [Candidatus Nanopelagicales bacterium]
MTARSARPSATPPGSNQVAAAQLMQWTAAPHHPHPSARADANVGDELRSQAAV